MSDGNRWMMQVSAKEGKVLVNPRHLAYITAINDKNCCIHIVGRYTVYCAESAESVETKFYEAMIGYAANS